MNQRGRIPALLLSLVMVFSAFAVLPLQTAFADGEENIALGKPAYANRNSSNAAVITDGDDTTYWSGREIPLYAEVDLQANYKLEKVVIKQPLKVSEVRSYDTAFNVYGSTDGRTFDRIGTMTAPEKADADGLVFEIQSQKSYRIVRVLSLMSTKGSSASTYISELEVYGEKTADPVAEISDTFSVSSYEEWLKKNCNVDLSAIKDANGKYDIKDTYTKEDTVAALEGLVSRILGEEYLSYFTFEIGAPLLNGNDYYEITDKDGKIHIKGNEGVSVASGLNYYLKYFCNVHISQETKQTKMPEKVVPVGKTIYQESPYEVRYAYNYCTLSYTMPFYGFDEWQRELDYLMLSGVNVVLDTTATEALWVLYLQNYGYSAREALQFVSGYTWKAWWLMGNLEGAGGPVSFTWMEDTVEMARRNQRYLAVMGADPCLQAFTGTLPTDFAEKADATLKEQGFENVGSFMTSTGSWAGFTRPYALNTTFPGFDSLAQKFYEVQNQIYGRIGDYYAGDFLHEISSGFQLDKSFNKAQMSRTVLDKLLEENSDAVWVIQSWWENPLPEVVEGWGEDREDHILLLDLASVQSPRWTNTTNYGGHEFGGTSWCLCILEDYGGREGAHLSLNGMIQNFRNAQKNAQHIKGIGLTSEGTERNPVVFDLFWELGWSDSAEVTYRTWIKDYAERRYGSSVASGTWADLCKTIYGTNTVDGTTINNAITNYPKFDYTGGYFNPSYAQPIFSATLKQLIGYYDELKDEETYIYDLVELLTTRLSSDATACLANAFKAAQEADYETFHANKTRFLRAMQLIDELAAFSENELLGKWVGRVDTWVNDTRTGTYGDFDVDLMKLDAVMLITNWSTIDLGNYANRSLNGLMEDYYYRMWSNFFAKAEKKVQSGKKITDGNDTMGVSNLSTYYNYGREIALNILNGKQYLSTPVPVEGDADHRSLKEVLEEIQRDYLENFKAVLNTASLIENDSVKSEDGKLTGIPDGTTAKELSALFTVTGGGAKVGFVDAKNKLCPEDTAVESGMKAVIVESDGSILDNVNLILEVSAPVIPTPTPLPTSASTPASEPASPDGTVSESTKTAASGSGTSDEENPSSATLYIVLIVAAVLVLGGGAAFFLLKKKKK